MLFRSLEGGANIPLTQIVAGPKMRPPISFEPVDDVRSAGEMISNPSPHGGIAAKKAGQRYTRKQLKHTLYKVRVKHSKII